VHDDRELRIKIGSRYYSFWADDTGLVTVKLGRAQRSATTGGLGVYGIARLLLKELIAEREASRG